MPFYMSPEMQAAEDSRSPAFPTNKDSKRSFTFENYDEIGMEVDRSTQT
jgi:hypothetical protein